MSKEYMTARAALPRIVIEEGAYGRLTRLAQASAGKMPDVAEVLLSELDRATVVAEEALPDSVVRMGSKVHVRLGNGRELEVTLVYPRDADISMRRISILTPIGAALIGLAEGQTFTWSGRDGRDNELVVLQVEPPRYSAGRP